MYGELSGEAVDNLTPKDIYDIAEGILTGNREAAVQRCIRDRPTTQYHKVPKSWLVNTPHKMAVRTSNTINNLILSI